MCRWAAAEKVGWWPWRAPSPALTPPSPPFFIPHAQASCAVSGEGLKEGLQWIARHVKAQNASIFPSLPSLT